MHSLPSAGRRERTRWARAWPPFLPATAMTMVGVQCMVCGQEVARPGLHARGAQLFLALALHGHPQTRTTTNKKTSRPPRPAHRVRHLWWHDRALREAMRALHRQLLGRHAGRAERGDVPRGKEEEGRQKSGNPCAHTPYPLPPTPSPTPPPTWTGGAACAAPAKLNPPSSPFFARVLLYIAVFPPSLSLSRTGGLRRHLPYA
jgi:hypothetical protein